MKLKPNGGALLLGLAALSGSVYAGGLAAPDMGKLLATGGVSQVEGAGGGGLTPWALISGYGTRDSYGANVHYTAIKTQDYALDTAGVAIGLFDRTELSFAHQEFRGTAKALNGVKIKQDVAGIKVKLIGDAVYEQDSWLPQIAVGALFKHNNGISGLEGLGVHNATDLGARANSGTDFYLSATKLYLAQSLLLNLTLRETRANQFGLLGFGGDKRNGYRLEPELSAAYLFNRRLVAGVEYRAKPRNLSVDSEEDAYDAFVAYFPSKNISLTAAYVKFGSIVKPFNPTNQRGPYLSLQVGF